MKPGPLCSYEKRKAEMDKTKNAGTRRPLPLRRAEVVCSGKEWLVLTKLLLRIFY
jgi:chorismate-pyruvate lyase